MGATVLVWDDELLDRLEIGLILTGLTDRRIRRANAAACRILGRVRADLVGAVWASLVGSPAVDGWAQLCRHVSGEQTTARQKVRLVRPDGNLVDVLITAVGVDSLVDDQCEPCCLGQMLDVTESETARHQLQLILENSPVSMALTDRAGRVLVYAGGDVPALVDDMKAAMGSSIFEVFTYAPRALELIRRAMDGKPGCDIHEAFGRCYELHIRPIYDPYGEVSQVASISTDVTDRELARSEQSALADLAHQALQTVEPDRLWNHAASVLARRLNATVIFHTTKPGREPDLVAAVGPLPPAAVTAAAVREARERTTRGRTGCHQALYQNDEGGGGHNRRAGRWSTLSVPVGRPGAPATVLTVHRADPVESPVAGGGQRDRRAGPGPATGPFTRGEAEFVDAVAAVLGSAAVRFAMEREARHRALHDSLTDLPNRTALLDRLRRSLKRTRNDTRHTGVIFVDLDGFKTINDTFGHHAGDTVLRQVADRLRTSVRPDDVVARLAGDEFAILCEHVNGVTEVEQVAHRIITALAATPIALSDADVTVTASAGVAVSGTNLTDPDRLLNASDVAMYAAKRAGPGLCVVHQPAMRLETAPSTPSQDHP